MKKLIVTGSLLCSLLFIVLQVHAQAEQEQMRVPAQDSQMQGQQGGVPGQGQGDMMQGQQGIPPQGKGMQQGQGMSERRPQKLPTAQNKMMMMNKEEKMMPQEMISGVQNMPYRMDNNATQPGQMRDMRMQMRMNVSTISGQMKEIRKENMNARCKLVVSRISRITSAAGMGIGGRQKAFQAIADRFVKLSENLAAKGVDVTELNATIETLNSKIAVLVTDYAAFIDTLDNTQQYECGNSEGQFKEAHAASAPAFQQVQADKIDIEMFLKNDMKAVLEDIRATAPPLQPSGIMEPSQGSEQLPVEPTAVPVN